MALLNEPDPDAPDFYSMTKAQLLDYAKDHGIEGVNSSMLKADILRVIENSEM